MEHLNLLPRERLTSLRREMAVAALLRLATTIVLGLTAVTAAGVLVGVGVWGLAIVDTDSSDDLFLATLAEYLTVRQQADETNQLLHAVDDLGRNRIVWSNLIVSLLPVLPPGATISALEIDGQDEVLSLSGTAPTRTALVSFETQLRELSWVADVEAPRDNLLRRDNPEYTFNLHVDPAKVVSGSPAQ